MNQKTLQAISKGETTRATIIEAALQQAAAKGLNGLSIGGLAERTGMSKSGLFGHFGSKESLQQAVLEALVEEFAASVIRPALRLENGLERIETLYDRSMRWATSSRHPGSCPFNAISVELSAQLGPHRDFLFEQQRRWMEVIARVAAKCVAEGSFRGDVDIQLFAFEFQNIVVGFDYASNVIGNPNAETLARQAFARLLRDAQP